MRGRHGAPTARSSFEYAGLDWQEHVRFGECYLHRTEVDALIGDRRQANVQLGWRATIHADELARIMVDAHLAKLKNGDEAWVDRPALET